MRLIPIQLVFLMLVYAISSTSVRAQTIPELGEGLSIQEILAIVANQKETNPAELRILLKNGFDFVGRVSSYAPEKRTFSLKDNSGVTTVIEISSISSVSILNPGSAINALRGNKIFRDISSPIPSRLSLLRDVENFNQDSHADIKLALSSEEFNNEDCRFYASLILNETKAALRNASEDALGREAVSKLENGLSISHADNSALSLINVDNGAELSFDCKSPLPGNFSDTIIEELNSLL